MEAPNWLIITFGLVGIISGVRTIRKRYVNTAVRAFSPRGTQWQLLAKRQT